MADIERFVPRADISTHPFENILYQIKCLLCGGNWPLVQVEKLISEHSKMFKDNSRMSTYPCTIKENKNEVHEYPGCNKVFSSLQIAESLLS